MQCVNKTKGNDLYNFSPLKQVSKYKKTVKNVHDYGVQLELVIEVEAVYTK